MKRILSRSLCKPNTYVFRPIPNQYLCLKPIHIHSHLKMCYVSSKTVHPWNDVHQLFKTDIENYGDLDLASPEFVKLKELADRSNNYIASLIVSLIYSFHGMDETPAPEVRHYFDQAIKYYDKTTDIDPVEQEIIDGYLSKSLDRNLIFIYLILGNFENGPKGAHYYNTGAKLGMIECYYHLANMYAKYEDTAILGKEAIKHFLSEADESKFTKKLLGDAYFLAGCLEVRVSNGNMEKAIKYHEKAASYNHPQSLIVCGSHYLENDLEKGKQYLELAFHQHENVFAINLMLNQSAGKGTPMSQEVLDKVVQLAESDKYFMFVIGDHLLKGTLQSVEQNIVNAPTKEPTPESYELGISFLEKALEKNHTGAGMALFKIYSDVFDDENGAKNILKQTIKNPDTSLVNEETIGQLHYIYATLIMDDPDSHEEVKEQLKIAAYRYDNTEARETLHAYFID